LCPHAAGARRPASILSWLWWPFDQPVLQQIIGIAWRKILHAVWAKCFFAGSKRLSDSSDKKLGIAVTALEIR
jgi:hypothetical protein